MLNGRLFFLLFCLLTLLSTSQLMACERPLIVARSSTAGLDEQIAGKILAEAGCQVKSAGFKGAVTFDRRLAMLMTGDIDLLISVNKLPDREAIGNFSLPYDVERVRLWTTQANYNKYKELDLPTIIKMGAMLNGPSTGWYGPDYESLRQANSEQLILYNSISHGSTLVAKGRADVLIGSEYYAEYFKPEYSDKLVQLPQVIHRENYHFMYSKKTVSQETIDLINNAIRKVLAKLQNP